MVRPTTNRNSTFLPHSICNQIQNFFELIAYFMFFFPAEFRILLFRTYSVCQFDFEEKQFINSNSIQQHFGKFLLMKY